MIYLGFSWYNTLNVRSMNLIANASKIPWTSLNVTGVCQIPSLSITLCLPLAAGHIYLYSSVPKGCKDYGYAYSFTPF